MGLPHHRQDSISSINSPHDVAGGWTPSSPGIAPSSRHASIYSLNGQFDSVGLSSSIDGSSNGSHMYEQSPPLPAQVRYAQAQALDARRFSLDERSIRAQPNMGKPGMISAEYQAPGQGRHWPWGNSNAGNIHGRHASVSAAPPQSYDYSRMPYGSTANSNMSYGYDANAMSAMSPTRYRSMSSSAASGRSYANAYGPPGTAAHAAAAMGYGMAPHMGPGMMMEGDIPGGPGPARRAKFKRSRTGCLVCRKRKVKCSQDGTPCKQCRIGKRDCYYDDNPQKKKTKKHKAGVTESSGDKTAATGAAPGSDQLSSLPSQDSYYPPGGVDHRGSVDAGLSGGSGQATGGVTFSMPFGASAAPAVAGTPAGTGSDGTWSNSSPFAPGPHGEPHPATHGGDYSWAPKDGAAAAHTNGYADSGDRRDSYWNQHPASYPPPRVADLEHAEAS